MVELNDEQLDGMLSGFFRNSLDGQRGRSEWNFRRYLKETARSSWKQRTWLIGAFATGMAASLAVLWAVPAFRASNVSPANELVAQHPTKTDGSTNAPTIVPSVERVVQSHTTDQGIILFGNDAPFRVIRRQKLEQIRTPNSPDKVQPGTPQDELLFIKVPTY